MESATIIAKRTTLDGEHTITRVERDNGTGYWKLDDGWFCDYPIMYDNGKFGFDNPEYFSESIITWTCNVIKDYHKNS